MAVVENRVERALRTQASALFAPRPWNKGVRRVFPQVADTVYAGVPVWISSTMLRNWPDPYGYWRPVDAWADALIALVYLRTPQARKPTITRSR
ncbi:hypothetical protein [Streptomyces sp. NBC_01314]|uniref:hypothetical protein n=1 Tax=Streptomyces sp. NBC_01314 TaxID=2903821 RepID=UPI0030905B16|nr:hypothetical protein OG622_20730 [Streptomyces sp. NBC_01314]